MDHEDGAPEVGGWHGPDEPDQTVGDQLRQSPRLLLLGLAILTVFVGLIILTQPFSGKTSIHASPSPPTPGTPLLGLSPGLAYDPIHGQAVLFNQLGQTWLFSGSTWAEAHPLVSPSGRIGAAMAWDPKLKAVLLFGGIVGEHEQPRDTWAWDGSNWRRVGNGVGAPPGGWAAMAYDLARHGMVLVVSPATQSLVTTETWVWDGVRWTRHAGHVDGGPAGYHSSLTFDQANQVIFAASMRCTAASCVVDTLTWDGLDWRRLSPKHQPTASAYMQVVQDPTSGRLILLTEGSTPPRAPAPTETWAWSSEDWSRLGTTGQAGGIVYAVTFGEPRRLIWAFEDTTPSAGSPRVDSAWILNVGGS
jgi:hypothetical protein